MDLPWDKLDVVTWSWQKVLGGEAAHGMLVLSPRAVARLESYKPAWPMPKIFRLTKDGKMIEGIFKGETINTPSMLAVEDAHRRAEMGAVDRRPAGADRPGRGQSGGIGRLGRQTPWVDFLAGDPAIRSCTSICLRITDPESRRSMPTAQADVAKKVASLLEKEGVAYDIAAYRDAPPACASGAAPRSRRSDIEALIPWLEWAFAAVNSSEVGARQSLLIARGHTSHAKVLIADSSAPARSKFSATAASRPMSGPA